MKTYLRHFWRDTRGAAAIMLSIGLIPTLVIGYGALQVAEYNTIATRLSQSQITALYAMGKGGPDMAGDMAESQGLAWMETNVSFLRRGESKHEIYMPTGNSSFASIVSSIPNSGLLSALAVNSKEITQARVASLPMELVFAISANTSIDGTKMTAAIEKLVDTAFMGQEQRDDIWVSLIYAASFVNIGTRYARQLVSSASRKPYHDFDDYLAQIQENTYLGENTGEGIRKSMKATRENTLAMLNGHGLANDLLQPGLPGYGLEEDGVICVHRPPLSDYDNVYHSPDGEGTSEPNGDPVSQTAINTYVENIFTAPATPAEGFDLVQGLPLQRADGKGSVIAGAGGRLPKNGVLMVMAMPTTFFQVSASASGYEGVMLNDVVKYPTTIADGYLDEDGNKMELSEYNSLLNSSLMNDKLKALASIPDPAGSFYNDNLRMIFLQAGSSSHTSWANRFGYSASGNPGAESMLSIPGGCPRTAMLIGSRNRQEILDRASLWGGATGRAEDEALAWGIRALSDDYSDIWGIEDYPAPFKTEGGERSKRLLLMADEGIRESGYGNKGWGSNDVFTPMCVAAKERGIELFILIEGKPDDETRNYLKACVDDDHLILYDNLSKLGQAMSELAERDYRVRIVAAGRDATTDTALP